MKNVYAIMNREEYEKVIEESTVSDNFPEEPPCEFPMVMVRIAIQNLVEASGWTRYAVLTSWIGIPAEEIKKVIFPFAPGHTTPFGKIEFTDAVRRTGVETGRFSASKENKANQPSEGGHMREHDGATYLHCTGCGTYVVEGEWEAHECPTESEEIPADIQERCNEGYDTDVEALDEEVHTLKSHEASGINNGGTEAQVKWLHDEAGMPWSEIRGLIGLKEEA